jgi:hypothetical protein
MASSQDCTSVFASIRRGMYPEGDCRLADRRVRVDALDQRWTCSETRSYGVVAIDMFLFL